MASSTVQPPLSGSAKLAAVTDLVNKLSQDLQKISLLPHQRDAALDELKVHGRDPRHADPIFTDKGIEMLTKHAFNSPSNVTSRNAMRCLANAMLMKPEARQTFVDLGYESKLCNKLKNDSWDDEFLASRILFLTTYGTNIKLEALIDKYHLADTVVHNLAKHVKLLTAKPPATSADPMESMALTETAKLLFNVTHFCSEKCSAFTGAVSPIVTLLCKLPINPTAPLDSPLGSLVNALLNLDLASKDAMASMFTKMEPNALAERLVTLLETASKAYNDADLEQAVSPLVRAIQRVQDIAPAGVSTFIRDKLLPTEEDRQKVLGESETVSSWLLRTSTNPTTPELRQSISHLLFDMSDKDATQFVKNVGYGFASGFLFSNDIPVPENASEAFSTGSTESSSRPVNPVTGQFLDRETEPDVPEMTQEEKEREAERLFVLFERLKQNGLISAENPVATAMREGRFADIDDDDRIEELD